MLRVSAIVPLFLLTLIATTPVRAVISPGSAEEELLTEWGEPQMRLERGSQKIFQYANGTRVVIGNGVVREVSGPPPQSANRRLGIVDLSQLPEQMPAEETRADSDEPADGGLTDTKRLRRDHGEPDAILRKPGGIEQWTYEDLGRQFTIADETIQQTKPWKSSANTRATDGSPESSTPEETDRESTFGRYLPSSAGDESTSFDEEPSPFDDESFPFDEPATWQFVAIGGMMLYGLVANIWFLVVAFRESVLWGIGCIVISPIGLVFLIMHWDEAKKPFLHSLASTAGIFLILLL